MAGNNETISVDVVLNDQRFQAGIRNIITQLNSTNRATREAGDGATNMGNAFSSAIKAMAGIGAVVGGINTVKKAFEGVVKTGMEYTKQMSTVEAISDSTSLQMAELGANARELGASTVWSATNVAEAYEYMATAGWSANEMIAGSKPLLNLATAGNLDLARAADIVTDSMTPFGMKADEAGRAADVFAKGSAAANLNVEQLGETMKYAAPIADTFGMNIEETTVLAMEFANGGIKASMAGTALRAGLSRLAKPPKAAANALADLGQETTNADGSMKNIRTIIDELSPKFNALSNSQQIAAAKAIFGEEAYAGWIMVLKNGVGEFDKFKGMLDKSEGSAEAMAKVMSNNLSGAVANTQSALENLGLIGFSKLELMLTNSTNGFGAWITKMSESIDPLGNVVEATKLLQTEQQKFAQQEALLLQQKQKGKINDDEYRAGLEEARKQLAANTTETGILEQKMKALDAEYAKGGMSQDQYKIKQQEAAKEAALLGQTLVKVGEDQKQANASFENFQYALSKVKDFMAEMWDIIKPIWETNLAWFNEQLKTVKKFIDENGKEIEAVWNVLWTAIKFIVIPIWEGIKLMIEGAMKIIMGVIQVVGGLINGDWEKVWEGVKNIFEGIWKAIIGFIDATVGKGLIGGLKKIFTKLADGFLDWAKRQVKDVGKWADDVVSFATNNIKGLPDAIWEWVKKVPGKIKDAFDDAVKWLKDLDWYDIGTSLIKSLIRGITAMSSSLWGTMSEIGSKLNPMNWFGGGSGRYMIDPENNSIGETMPRSPFGFDILDESRGKFNRLPLQFFAGGGLQEAIAGTMGAVNSGLGSALGASRSMSSQLNAGARHAGQGIAMAGMQQSNPIYVTVDVPLQIDGNTYARATAKYTQPRNSQFEKRNRTPFSI